LFKKIQVILFFDLEKVTTIGNTEQLPKTINEKIINHMSHVSILHDSPEVSLI